MIRLAEVPEVIQTKLQTKALEVGEALGLTNLYHMMTHPNTDLEARLQAQKDLEDYLGEEVRDTSTRPVLC